MTTVQDLLRRLRESVREVEPRAAAAEAAAGALLLDVREREEWDAGHAAGAVHLSRGMLEMSIERVAPDRGRRMLLYCAAGNRSLLAAESLQRLGYRDVASVAGGFTRWMAAGLGAAQADGLSAPDRRRYARHLTLPEVGEAGQLRLLASRVLLVGAGGLGSPAALYLAAAGVGRLTVVDFDVVDETNLQRQVVHDTRRLGRPKAQSARETLLALNPAIEVVAVDERLSPANVERLFEGQHVILDGSDNFSTRYLVNDACVKLGVPNVHGSVYRFEGQVTVFWPGRGPCYRCLFPEPPPPGLAPSCAEAGVLGILPGVIGLLEAVETIKALLGAGDLLVGRLLAYDALAASFTELELRRDPDCATCAPGRPFAGYREYDDSCAVP